MLVLSGKKDESIIIGEGIEITIVRVNGNKVTVGVTAPGNIPVYRKEIAPFCNCGDTEFVPRNRKSELNTCLSGIIRDLNVCR